MKCTSRASLLNHVDVRNLVSSTLDISVDFSSNPNSLADRVKLISQFFLAYPYQIRIYSWRKASPSVKK
jgi:hypothetical protein